MARSVYRWLNPVGVVAVLLMNVLANLLPLGGKSTGEIADQFPVLVIPAGYVFLIWSLIYVLLIGFAIYQALPSQQDNPDVLGTDGLFLLTCLCNIGWLLLWHYGFINLSLPAMIALLASLVVLYRRVHADADEGDAAGFWLLQLPFRVYLAWICIATIENISIVLYNLGWDGFGIQPEAWAVFVLALGLAIAFAQATPYRDVAFLLVFLWAYIGIGVKQQAYPPVPMAAYFLSGLVALYALRLLLTGHGQEAAR
ncbi:hypothetical protein J31TS4_33790 [Paenibacillus sp. J31TS4]|uniref:tryptophan-rich sensory protein n=1 Tax=Paenibacillus sp. J31TS4 TaxID=2807195 RepID=UPI001B1E4E54|nr:tryptophan-rich sensory protein [Paenibacillus sp. J31TS4]GIP40099.1 hypothetical protein J31TS4_33790 [Paenibacillus sp. J31TS4]